MSHTPPERPYPRAAVSTAVFRDGLILIGERGKPPRQGIWSLPGGHVEPGETVREAALREVQEETAITAEIFGLLDVHDVISQDAEGRLRAHYVLTIFYGRWCDGEVVAGSDCRNARFVPLDALRTYPLTAGVETFIHRAYDLVYKTQNAITSP